MTTEEIHDMNRQAKGLPPLNAAPLPAPCRPFPVELLPTAIGNFIKEASTAIGCDPAFVGLPVLACLARAIGNKRVIKLKRTWTEPAIIWGAIVGKSGSHKSPALQAATAFLARKQSAAIEAHAEALAKYEQDIALYERDLAQWKKSKSMEPPPWEPQAPHCPRFIVGDITVEALADRLAGQFDGVLVVRDELAGWLDGQNQYKGGKGSDTAHWLATWSAAPLTVDRKTGPTPMIHIPRAAVSIVGGIQPGILQRAIGREHMSDGMCARVLLAMPAPRPVSWTEATIRPETEALLDHVLDKLLALEPAADETGRPAPFPIPLTTEGKAAWVEYYNRHRAAMISLDDDLAAAGSKLEAYSARFALIFQLCSWASGEASADHIDQASIEAGIGLSDFFGAEAKRVYGVLAESDEDRDRRELAEWIGRRGGNVTARELQRGPRQYRQADLAEAALADLVKHGWGRWHTMPSSPTGGHSFRVFILGDGDASHVKREENGASVAVASVEEVNRKLAEGAA